MPKTADWFSFDKPIIVKPMDGGEYHTTYLSADQFGLTHTWQDGTFRFLPWNAIDYVQGQR